MAKVRVAPIKVTTIPRLKLSAAVVAAKMSVMLGKELEIDGPQEYFWTDSKVVLGYINNAKQGSRFKGPDGTSACQFKVAHWPRISMETGPTCRKYQGGRNHDDPEMTR